MTTYILMAGLPGTGKSTLANALAERLHGVVLNKDNIRAALFPGALTDYSPEQDDLCFAVALEAAHYLATHNETEFIFLDGRTFSRQEHIEWAIKAAEKAGCEWKILHATCADAIAEARILQGAANHPAANRTVEMYRELKARFEAICRRHLDVDTSQSLECCVRQALTCLQS